MGAEFRDGGNDGQQISDWTCGVEAAEELVGALARQEVIRLIHERSDSRRSVVGTLVVVRLLMPRS
jgi:hypothetical protein